MSWISGACSSLRRCFWQRGDAEEAPLLAHPLSEDVEIGSPPLASFPHTQGPLLSWRYCCEGLKNSFFNAAVSTAGLASIVFGGTPLARVIGTSLISFGGQGFINQRIPKDRWNRFYQVVGTAFGCLPMHILSQIAYNDHTEKADRGLNCAVVALGSANLRMLLHFIRIQKYRESGPVFQRSGEERELPKFIKTSIPRLLLDMGRVTLAILSGVAAAKAREDGENPVWHDLLASIATFYSGRVVGGVVASFFSRKIIQAEKESLDSQIGSLTAPNFRIEGIRKKILRVGSFVLPFFFVFLDKRVLVIAGAAVGCTYGFIEQSGLDRLKYIPIQHLQEVQKISDSEVPSDSETGLRRVVKKVSKIGLEMTLFLGMISFDLWQSGVFGDYGSILHPPHRDRKRFALALMTAGTLLSFFSLYVVHKNWNLDERKTCENPSTSAWMKDVFLLWGLFEKFGFFGLPPAVLQALIDSAIKINSRAIEAEDDLSLVALADIGELLYGIALGAELFASYANIKQGSIPRIPIVALFYLGRAARKAAAKNALEGG